MPFSTYSNAFDKYSHDDWVCFVAPFDLNPENRINVLTSMNLVGVLHVQSDGKTLVSQKKLKVRKIENIDNARTFGFNDGSAMGIIIEPDRGFNTSTPSGEKLKIEGEWHPALYFKGNSGGGVFYKCKAVEIIKN